MLESQDGEKYRVAGEVFPNSGCNSPKYTPL